MKVKRQTRQRGRVLHISRVWGSHHGGSIYSRELVEELIARGWEVTVLAEQFVDPAKSAPELVLRAFFRRAPWAWPGRVWEIWKLFRFAVGEPRALVIVQGDLPRLTYLLLQWMVPLIFIRQDGILTCPGNNRFLRRSRSICAKPAGFSCLLTHQTQGCMGQISLWRRAGRVAMRIRDRILVQYIRHFLTSSQYLARIHGRPTRVLYPPLMTCQRDEVRPSPGAEICDAATRQTIPATERQRTLLRPGTGALRGRDMHRLVFCGRLEEVKGAGDAIRILGRLPRAYYLEILGEGAERQRLARLVNELQLSSRVRFWGWVDETLRDQVLASAGALLMPSLWDEAFGMAGIEAFAQGTPVVAYNVGGISEWCRDGAGILVKCGDAPAAARAVRELCEDPVHWEACSRTAQRVAESFAQGLFGRKLNAIVAEAMANAEILKN